MPQPQFATIILWLPKVNNPIFRFDWWFYANIYYLLLSTWSCLFFTFIYNVIILIVPGMPANRVLCIASARRFLHISFCLFVHSFIRSQNWQITVKTVRKQMNLITEANEWKTIELISSSMAKYSQISSQTVFFLIFYLLKCEFTFPATGSYQQLRFHFILLEINGLNRLTLTLLLFMQLTREIFNIFANRAHRTKSKTNPYQSKLINNLFNLFFDVFIQFSRISTPKCKTQFGKLTEMCVRKKYRPKCFDL